MVEQIANELDRRAKVIGGRPWGADKQKPRIYINVGRKDVSAFFAYPDAVYEPSEKNFEQTSGLGKAELKVFIEDSGQGKEWYMTEKEKVRTKLRPKLLSLMAFDLGDEDLADELAKATSMDDSLYDSLFNLLNDAKLDEARAALAGGAAF